MDINLRKNKPVIIGELINEFMENHKDKFAGVPTVTELRSIPKKDLNLFSSADYRIPQHEISIWKENGWKLSDCKKFMTLGKNKQVFIKK